MKPHQGFTLIEVLLAIALLAISLTALLKSISHTINFTNRIKTSIISELISEQALALIQLGFLDIDENQEVTKVTTLLNKKIYWRAKLNQSSIKSMKIIKINTSENITGPFTETLTGFQLKKN